MRFAELARAAFAFGVVLVAGAGCTINSRGAAVPIVLMRAEKDLDCPQKEIRLETLEIGNRYKAIGCGRTKIYRTACLAGAGHASVGADSPDCAVSGEGEPAIPWADRPEPDEFHR